MSQTGPFVRPATSQQRAIGMLLLAAAFLYMWRFVPRGWIPHDEGQIGEAAEWILHGRIPHVDYEDPYTGGLSFAYALLFRLTGIELLHVRWLLFAGACAALWTTYLILRRFLGPIGAGLAVWVATAWSFPNYFAGLPSWWLLILAILVTWCVIRYFETDALSYVVAAGLAVGSAIAIKQTGVYLSIALAMALFKGAGGETTGSRGEVLAERIIRIALAVATSLLAFLILGRHTAPAEVVHLIVPIIACAVTFAAGSPQEPTSAVRKRVFVVAAAAAAAALPVAFLIVPYVLRGQLGSFIFGAWVLPQRRLTFASFPMPPLVLTGFGLLTAAGMILTPPSGLKRHGRAMSASRWTAALALPMTSLSHPIAYQAIWQSARVVAALAPITACWWLRTRRITGVRAQTLFAVSVMLAWASMGQLPYAAPIYFTYMTPLAVIATVAVVDAWGWRRFVDLPSWAAMITLFAVLTMHRGYLFNLGRDHREEKLNVPLNLPRAQLLVREDEAIVYHQAVELARSKLNAGQLVAGPDCPEIYFLLGRFSPTGTLYDFFSDASDAQQTSVWLSASVVVINLQPAFSAQLPAATLSKIRSEFPFGDQIGKFEVRWR